jgi:hypothetical protein
VRSKEYLNQPQEQVNSIVAVFRQTVTEDAEATVLCRPRCCLLQRFESVLVYLETPFNCTLQFLDIKAFGQNSYEVHLREFSAAFWSQDLDRCRNMILRCICNRVSLYERRLPGTTFLLWFAAVGKPVIRRNSGFDFRRINSESGGKHTYI